MKTCRHLAAARALINISQKELAEASGLNHASIQRMEHPGFGPDFYGDARLATVEGAFSRMGVSFSPDGDIQCSMEIHEALQIKAARILSGMTQMDLARAAGVTPIIVDRIETSVLEPHLRKTGVVSAVRAAIASAGVELDASSDGKGMAMRASHAAPAPDLELPAP